MTSAVLTLFVLPAMYELTEEGWPTVKDRLAYLVSSARFGRRRADRLRRDMSRPLRSRLAVLALCAFVGACQADPGYGGRTSNEWINELADPDPLRRAEATRALGRVLAIRPDFPKVVRALVLALADSSDPVRLGAARALVSDEVKAVGAVPGIVAALADSAHPSVRYQAALLLGYFDSEAQAVVPVLIRALSDPEPQVRAAAAESLGKIGAPTIEAVAALHRFAHDPDAVMRRTAIDAVRDIGGPVDQVIPLFEHALRDSALYVRTAAGYALATLKEQALPAAGSLLDALSDPAPEVRGGAAFALGEIGTGAVRARAKLLTLSLTDPRAQVRAFASDALAGVEGRPHPHQNPPEPTLSEKCKSPARRTDRRC